MKIRKIHIKNYKVFDDITLDFTDKNGKTLDVVVFAGLNGCGKTTLLEVIKNITSQRSFLKKGTTIDVEFDCSSVTDFDIFKTSFSEKFKQIGLDFHFKEKKLFICYEGELFISRGMIDNFRDFFMIGEFKDFFKVFHKRVAPITSALNSIPDTPLTNFLHLHDSNKNYHELAASSEVTNTLDLILKQTTAEIFKNPDLPSAQVLNKGVENINKIFEGLSINSKLTAIKQDDLIFTSTNGQKIGFNALSAGEKQLYYMGFALSQLNPENGIIMIDEPEDSLHPTWQQQLVRFYQNAGTNNQVFLATHSPHIIGSVPAENLFLLKPENGTITVSQPKYSKGHSVAYVLSEIMDTDYRNTHINNLTDEYLRLIREKKHENERGQVIWSELSQLDPVSEERMQIDFALRRHKAFYSKNA